MCLEEVQSRQSKRLVVPVVANKSHQGQLEFNVSVWNLLYDLELASKKEEASELVVCLVGSVVLVCRLFKRIRALIERRNAALVAAEQIPGVFKQLETYERALVDGRRSEDAFVKAILDKISKKEESAARKPWREDRMDRSFGGFGGRDRQYGPDRSRFSRPDGQRRACFNCGEQGHFVRSCTKPSNK